LAENTDYLELMTKPGYKNALGYHPEVEILFRCKSKLTDPVKINGVDPILHVTAEAVAYDAVNSTKLDAARDALKRLKSEGLSEHAALAGIGRIILAEMDSVPLDGPANLKRLNGRLKLLSSRPFKSPGRNDPCPCGSGRKFKKCCLPLAQAFSVDRYAGQLDLRVGRYVTSHRIEGEPEDSPLYTLENRAHIADYLQELGLLEEAREALEQNYRGALSIDARWVENALCDLLFLCLDHKEFSRIGIEYARKLLPMVNDPETKATIRCDLADLTGRADGFEQGEKEYQRMIADNPKSWFFRYRKALYLLEHGPRDEAKHLLVEIVSQGKDSKDKAVEWAREVLRSEFGSDSENSQNPC